MKNKHLVPLFGLLVTLGLGACEVTIYNNTPYLATLTDLNKNEDNQTRLIPLFTKKLEPVNGKRAHFEITVYKKFGLNPVTFTLKQTACAKTHEIDLSVNKILDQELGKYEKVFTVKKEEPKKEK